MYLIPKLIELHDYKKLSHLLFSVGLFFGLWATYWKIEDGYLVTIWHYSLYVTVSTVFLMWAYLINSASSEETFYTY